MYSRFTSVSLSFHPVLRGRLVKSDEEIVCVVCGWRSYPIPRRLRLGPRDRPTPRPRAPRRPRSLSAGRLPRVRGRRRHRETLSPSPGPKQRRRSCSSSDSPRCAALSQLRAAGGLAGLLRWPPRRSQHPPAAGAASANRCTGLVVLNVQLLDVDVDRAAVVVWQA